MNNISEGCSACACGVSGACDKLYFPGFLWPGIAILLTLLVVVFLGRKKVIKHRYKKIIAGWLVLVLVFAGAVYFKTESADDLTQQAAQECQASGDLSCEY